MHICCKNSYIFDIAFLKLKYNSENGKPYLGDQIIEYFNFKKPNIFNVTFLKCLKFELNFWKSEIIIKRIMENWLASK